MNKITSISCVLALATSTMLAQVPTEPPSPPPSYPLSAPELFSPEQLDQLLGPIALYPDALVALMLPASTDLSDLTMAAQYLQAGGDPNQAESQPWDESVRALAHYPEVVTWMAQNVAWTQQLGEQFATQPAEVMNAVQRLRARARAAGTLVDTPQQQVVFQDNVIAIVPTQPDVIYVPYYDPAVVYIAHSDLFYRPSFFFGFSAGFPCGLWLSYGLDWHARRVWTVDRDHREEFWREHRNDWNRRIEPPRPSGHLAIEVHTWHPRPDFGRSRQLGSPTRPPQFMPGSQTSGPRRDPPHAAPHDSNRSRDERGHATMNQPQPAAQPPFVGPTALRSPLPQPLTAPRVVPQIQPSPRQDHPVYGQRNRDAAQVNAGPHVAPAPNAAPVPTARYVPPAPGAGVPNTWVHPTRPAASAFNPPAAPRAAPVPQYARPAPSPAAPTSKQPQTSSDSDEAQRRSRNQLAQPH